MRGGGCWGRSGCWGDHQGAGGLPGGLGVLLSPAAAARCRAPAPEAFGCGGRNGEGGEVSSWGSGSPSTLWVPPASTHKPAPCPPRPDSPELLRPRLLAGLVLPRAAPRRWLQPGERLVRAGRGVRGDPPAQGGCKGMGTVTLTDTSRGDTPPPHPSVTSYFLSSTSFCRCCRARTKAVGSKRGGWEP